MRFLEQRNILESQIKRVRTMESSPRAKRPNKSRETKGSQNSSAAQKDAYARLLSQHKNGKFQSYLQEFSKQSSAAQENAMESISMCGFDQSPLHPTHETPDNSNSFHLDKSESDLTDLEEQNTMPTTVKNHVNRELRVDDASQAVSSHWQQKRRENELKGIVGSEEDDAQHLSSTCVEDQSRKKTKRRRSKKKTGKKNKAALAPEADIVSAGKFTDKSVKAHQAQAHKEGSQANSSHTKSRRLFEDYMSKADVSNGLKRGDLVQGVLRINPKKYKEAFVPSPDGSADIFLDGMLSRNRALNGDVVVVKILSQQTDRQNSPNEAVEALSTEDEEVISRMKAVGLHEADPTKPITPESNSPKTTQRTGKVVYIVEKKHSRAASGFLKFLPNQNFAMFSPVDHRVPRVNVPLSDCPADFRFRPGDYEKTLFICRITQWSADSNFAVGRLAKSLGQAGEIDAETEGILTEYDVDFSDFSEQVLKCLPDDLPWTIPADELARRRDLRKECIFTIDPATARDLDDALSCKPLSDGNFEVGVHIADVSYFVKEGNALDQIASRRATSVYLVQKVVPMLPRLLCEELCSLNPMTDRLTVSVIWTMTPEGKILSEWFGRSVIRSCVKLSYDHAQNMIDAPYKHFGSGELPACSPDHTVLKIQEAVVNLHKIAKCLRAQRFHDGALRLDQMKLSFTLNLDTGMPQGCYVYQYRDSNKLVEEFMLLANMAAAHQIYRTYPTLALLRRHPTPQTKMLDDLQEFLTQMGLDVDFSSPGALHRSLNENLCDEYTAARKEVLTHMCSRPMQMAVYFCAGVLKDEKLFRHYALNVPLYTHFTSPIRRYPDVIVHRMLTASLNCAPGLRLTDQEIDKLASHCNDRKTASKRVQELSSELFFSSFVKECGPLDSEAMVMGVLDQSFDVLVLRYGVQKRIYCKSLEGLKTFHFRQVGKRPEMTLVWETEEMEEPIHQEISIFTLMNVQLKAESSTKYVAVLQTPVDKRPCPV